MNLKEKALGEPKNQVYLRKRNQNGVYARAVEVRVQGTCLSRGDLVTPCVQNEAPETWTVIHSCP